MRKFLQRISNFQKDKGLGPYGYSMEFFSELFEETTI
jgi:hypothetical protein